MGGDGIFTYPVFDRIELLSNKPENYLRSGQSNNYYPCHCFFIDAVAGGRLAGLVAISYLVALVASGWWLVAGEVRSDDE